MGFSLNTCRLKLHMTQNDHGRHANIVKGKCEHFISEHFSISLNRLMLVKVLLKCAIRFSILLVGISEFLYANFSFTCVRCTHLFKSKRGRWTSTHLISHHAVSGLCGGLPRQFDRCIRQTFRFNILRHAWNCEKTQRCERRTVQFKETDRLYAPSLQSCPRLSERVLRQLSEAYHLIGSLCVAPLSISASGWLFCLCSLFCSLTKATRPHESCCEIQPINKLTPDFAAQPAKQQFYISYTENIPIRLTASVCN